MGLSGIKFKYKVWLECSGKPLLGRGRYELLKNIGKTKSLKKSAENVGISYKTAFNYIRKMENNIGKKIIETKKGGISAGGSTVLNKCGIILMKKYEEAVKIIK